MHTKIIRKSLQSVLAYSRIFYSKSKKRNICSCGGGKLLGFVELKGLLPRPGESRSPK